MMWKETIVLVLSAMRGPDPALHAKMIDPEPVAAEIAEAAEETPLFDGAKGAEQMALVLVAIAHHESSLLERVRTCEVKGDGGRAIGLWQTHRFWWKGHSEGEVCQSSALQARIAAKAIRYQVDRGVRSVPALMRAFASGSAGTRSRQADEMTATYKRVLAQLDQTRP